LNDFCTAPNLRKTEYIGDYAQKEERNVERKELANFTVRVLSAENSTWQGEVESGGETFAFQSEMQLLKWLCKKYPRLMPNIEDLR